MRTDIAARLKDGYDPDPPLSGPDERFERIISVSRSLPQGPQGARAGSGEETWWRTPGVGNRDLESRRLAVARTGESKKNKEKIMIKKR